MIFHLNDTNLYCLLERKSLLGVGNIGYKILSQ